MKRLRVTEKQILADADQLVCRVERGAHRPGSVSGLFVSLADARGGSVNYSVSKEKPPNGGGSKIEETLLAAFFVFTGDPYTARLNVTRILLAPLVPDVRCSVVPP